ncbi:hypothetical protein OCU04_008385 [Sclerotinia nivalis]|uniref:Uncharacterized protein n=1 Tax=Sclerotinia nivalis TaxID=352851 RepID=A0A9X0AIU5_9HELO|nr:hypothetical protein OCU04_008385 [Sclerotinia nivalis]
MAYLASVGVDEIASCEAITNIDCELVGFPSLTEARFEGLKESRAASRLSQSRAIVDEKRFEENFCVGGWIESRRVLPGHY